MLLRAHVFAFLRGALLLQLCGCASPEFTNFWYEYQEEIPVSHRRDVIDTDIDYTGTNGDFADCSTTGAQSEWSGTIQFGTTRDDEIEGVGIDLYKSCDIYLEGTTTGNLPGRVNMGLEDIFLAKLSQSNEVRWAEQIGTSESDHASGLAVWPLGVYIAGNTEGSLMGQPYKGGGDYVIARYTAAGELDWITQKGSSAYDRSQSILVYPTGHGIELSPDVFIAGYTLSDAAKEGASVTLAKVRPSSGLTIESKTGTPRDDVTIDATIDSLGNVYAVGGTTGDWGSANAGSFDSFLLKYNPDLQNSWIRTLGTDDIDGAQAVTVDHLGNIYVALVSYSDLETNVSENDGIREAFLAKYTADGQLDWLKKGPSSAGRETIPIDISADHHGGIYLAGYTDGDLVGKSGGGHDAFLAKYGSDGALLWVDQMGTSQDDVARLLVTDLPDQVFVAGVTRGELVSGSQVGGQDIFIMKYDSQGNKL